MGALRKDIEVISNVATQHRVHPTLGILPRFQAFFYALAFFWLDGFAVPAPAQVTQSVGRLSQITIWRFCIIQR